MAAPLMTLLVRPECPLDRTTESGFDDESHGLREGSAGHYSF